MRWDEYHLIRIYKSASTFYAKIPSKPGQVVVMRVLNGEFTFPEIREYIPEGAKRISNEKVMDKDMRVFDRIVEELEKLT